MKVIGIVGQPSAGKDTLANYIKTKGFKAFSSGDFIRADMRKENLPLDREHMHAFSTRMREIHGMEYPLQNVVKEMAENSVISGMRNTTQIEYLKKFFGDNFVLIGLEAPIEVRYKRGRGRGRDGDGISFKVFKEQEEAERNNTAGVHNVDAVMAMTDYRINTEGTEEELFKKADELLATL